MNPKLPTILPRNKLFSNQLPVYRKICTFNSTLNSDQMQTTYRKSASVAVLFIFCALTIHSQTTTSQSPKGASIIQTKVFRKGSVLVGLSEGSTHASYTTVSDANPNHMGPNQSLHGQRDPLAFEYGLTDHWGIGFSSGNDIFNINPNTFYNTDAFTTNAKATTSEFTLNLSYHFWVTEKNDLSLTGSFGSSSVSLSGNAGENKYQYLANGNIARLGLNARHYFYRRMGVLAILSAYNSGNSTQNISGNTFGNCYSTSIKGYAIEFGFCFRLRH
jgi:hypothetical protein